MIYFIIYLIHINFQEILTKNSLPEEIGKSNSHTVIDPEMKPDLHTV